MLAMLILVLLVMLSQDFFRLKGQRVFFLTGTDEHGLKIQQVTKDKDIEPQDFVDQMSANFQNLTKSLNLSNDDFIRTTSKDMQLVLGIFGLDFIITIKFI